MDKKHIGCFALALGVLMWFASTSAAQTTSEAYKGNIYQPGTLKPVDSVLKVKVGDRAPDFTLPDWQGTPVRLSEFRDRQHVVLVFNRGFA